MVGLQLHVILITLRVWSTCKVKNSEKWPTWAYRITLNKSMRRMKDSSSIDLMMKLCDVGGINQTLHRDWKDN